MDKMKDSGSLAVGSIPAGGASKEKRAISPFPFKIKIMNRLKFGAKVQNIFHCR